MLLPHHRSGVAIIVDPDVYEPTQDYEDKIIEKLYEELKLLLTSKRKMKLQLSYAILTLKFEV